MSRSVAPTAAVVRIMGMRNRDVPEAASLEPAENPDLTSGVVDEPHVRSDIDPHHRPVFPAGHFIVVVWVTAPGDFPSPAVTGVLVPANSVVEAAEKAPSMVVSGDPPVVVSVSRMDLWPPGVKP